MINDNDVVELRQDGDLSETSVRNVSHIVLCGSEPPRAIISVSKPMAPDVALLARKADSSLLQAGACLSQPSYKSQSHLSQITKVPLVLHHTQSLDANQLLNILPPAPHHTITNFTSLHGPGLPAHTHLHSTSIPSVSPQSNTLRSGDTVVHQTLQTGPSTRPVPSAVAEATHIKPHTTPDNQTGLMSTVITQSTNSSSLHTPGPIQTSVGETNRQSPPAAVTPVSQTVVTPSVVAFQPVVIVKQFQTSKPYSGQSSHRSFHEHFERVAKANGWSTEQEKMQNLALALEGPAVECLKEVREDEHGAYERLWAILDHRFGYLDEPERAMRKFDTRRQLDGESVAEYEQALRTLYRETWPRADEVTRDAVLKRKFEEGFSSGEMLQFLRLHARQDDFGHTVAKARRFADTQKAVQPKKAVRILEAPEREQNAETMPVGTTSFQPLLDGFKEVIQTVLQDRS